MSRAPRFFISPEQVSGPHITVSGEDVRHIAAVLRMKAGDSLLLSDGEETEYTVRIAQVGKTEIRTEIVNRVKQEIIYPRYRSYRFFQGFSPNSELRTPNFAPPSLGRGDHADQRRSPRKKRRPADHRPHRP